MALIYSGPMHRQLSKSLPQDQSWSVRIPIILTAAGKKPLPGDHPEDWVIDTGFTGEAFAWRHNLEAGGIDFEKAKNRLVSISSTATGVASRVWLCRGELWLVSNVPGGRHHWLQMQQGVTCSPDRVLAPDSERHRRLIGMRLLIRHRLRMECDFADRTFSIWSTNR